MIIAKFESVHNKIYYILMNDVIRINIDETNHRMINIRKYRFTTEKIYDILKIKINYDRIFNFAKEEYTFYSFKKPYKECYEEYNPI